MELLLGKEFFYEVNVVFVSFRFLVYGLYSQPVFEVGVIKDHLVLDLQSLPHSGLGGPLIHGISDADVGVGKPHGVKVNAFVLGFSAGLLSGH